MFDQISKGLASTFDGLSCRRSPLASLVNDCSTCNSSVSDICHYVKITCLIKFQRGWHRLLMVFRVGAHHSHRSCLVLAGFARSCLALSPRSGEMTFITRCPSGKKLKDKNQERVLRRLPIRLQCTRGYCKMRKRS